ncbi:hypothetical protein [Clostridium sp. CCUG 7971]|uniref:hypothetical protein n=1 Tax=Clostridium sp. CCUG 7971 TaxID=2811414 RepID=UPI001ABAD483|nr:hypothetical protein [Clostridium sp. CCUG 7971]MBO3444919.1 hypothetical protein [Clostridium sp. CCUG 7971]
MGNDIKLVYCILGSVIIALLSATIFQDALVGGFYQFGLYGIGEILLTCSKVLSSIGVILTVYYSLKLIIRNTNLKDK